MSITYAPQDHSAADHPSRCRCGQDLDLCRTEHCPRCGATLRQRAA